MSPLGKKAKTKPAVHAPAVERHELTFSADDAGERLDVVLARRLPQYSRARLQRWIEERRVLVDGVVPARRVLVREAQQARIDAEFIADERVQAGKPAVPFRVLYRDAVIYVIHKPPGLVVHPGAGVPSGTLQNALLALDPQLAKVPRAGIVHRLDKDTSGLLAVARTPVAHAALVRALAARELGREYLALCHGLMTGGGTIAEPIGRHRTQRKRMAVRADGREAVTHYRIERRFRAHTLARVQLETGRTHQIRVHLRHAGYPIVGDPVYGGRKRSPAAASLAVLAALSAFQRQALHATRLEFAHPVSGRPLAFEAPLPKDFAALLKILAAEAVTA
ncbi:MAG: 23S rRNA pseudouridine(1911/1915/1917) synthase RluD [Gammaproteobacteria bacterium]|nr:23S rRNA pseudouridine(1911/1915/1917) synthase RluD [Gammaproteobacteria bacterium]